MGTPQSDFDLQPVNTRLGDEVRRLRKAAGLRQRDLADRVHYSRSYIALIETGRERPSAEAVERIAEAVGDDGRVLSILRRAHRTSGRPEPLAILDFGKDAMAEVASNPSTEESEHLVGGSSVFEGALVKLVPFEADARSYGLQRTLAVSARGGVRYAMDAHELLRRPRRVVPAAYRLDGFTLAILCAVANLDDALLADDTSLTEARAAVVEYEQLRGSTASRDIVRELQAVSQMWLGSYFCVRHILRNAMSFTDTPVFWTAEKRGEESANWLVFKHKHKYLQELEHRFGRTTRLFCIPEEAVRSSPLYERVLMFLSAALMESLSITVHVISDPAYESVGGFVVTPSSRALVADWLRAEGVWHVDSTTKGTTVREFKDIAEHGAAHSILNAPTSKMRLQALAAYLDLDWGWLVRRASEIRTVGVRPFASPRSRFLSLAGVEAACEYVQGLRHRQSSSKQRDL